MRRARVALAVALLATACHSGPSPVEHGFVPAYVPQGMHVAIARENYRDSVSSDGSMRLYADSRWERGEHGGRAVAILSESDYTSLPFAHPAEYTTRVAGHSAFTGTHDGYGFVVWKMCPSPGCDHEWDVAVVGTGLADSELRALAERATVTRQSVALRGLPTGMEARAGGPLSLFDLREGEGAWRGRATVLRYENRDRSLQFTIVDSRSPLGFLLRFVIAKPNGARLRDQPALRGRPIAFDDTVTERGKVWTWKERGARIMVLAVGVPDDQVERSIRSLREATPQDWDRLRRAVG